MKKLQINYSSSSNLMFLILFLIYIQLYQTAATALLKTENTLNSQNLKKSEKLERDMPLSLGLPINAGPPLGVGSIGNRDSNLDSDQDSDRTSDNTSGSTLDPVNVQPMAHFSPGYDVESMTQTFTIDAKLQTCDVGVRERVKFKLQTPSDTINYMIISKKTPLYGFHVNIINSNIYNSISVLGMKIYQDGTFRQRVFMDSEGRSLSFRDRWMVTTQLNAPVQEVELEYSYFMQRAILIDTTNEANKFKVDIINPLPYTIQPHQFIIDLKNFKKLKPDQLKAPQNSLINFSSDNKNIQIVTSNSFSKHSEYEINLTLPYEITSCEGNIVNIVFYGLVGMSFIFVIMSIATMSYLYKE